MRTDQNLGRQSFRHSPGWKEDQGTQNSKPNIDNRLEGYEVLPDGRVVVHSLSGNETNRLFMNQNGTEFENTSAISGLDNPADSRGWALLDYDRDGWQDVALVNANTPLLNLYHNNIKSLPASQTAGVIAMRFVGGGEGHSPRDGYGALVTVTLPDGTILKREHRCGEGYSSQNSATVLIGIGTQPQALSINVKWPSGKLTSLQNVAEGTLVTAFEQESQDHFTQQPYRLKLPPRTVQPTTPAKFPYAQVNNSKIHLYTTTATWCTACLGHLPSLKELKNAGIPIFGLPVDPNDTPEILASYLEGKKPPYQMLSDLSTDDRQIITALLSKELGTDNPPLPSSIVTDSEGTILATLTGIPSLSQIRRLFP